MLSASVSHGSRCGSRQATVWARQALAVFEGLGDEHGRAYAERALADATYNRGNHECAARLLRDAQRRIDPNERREASGGLTGRAVTVGLPRRHG
jgi:hypothetical protein